MNSTLERIEGAQASRRRKKTKREVQRLGDSGIVRVKDANRSIADRKAKDDEKNKKAAKKAYLKAYGHPPPAPYIENKTTDSNAVLAEESGDQLYFIDSTGV
ncbi:uncharacterized protein ATNIH1004_011670 [Aspergillus tanneri]|uniref:Uncharacterized protein n=1 Tax=Aspergillus tanneri TaxID=1220188 RepID=A0A5M9M865_9EURO|nr:uncharacterized protein ATNIH1004_011670 [Aspergillus tanneri]KAA8641534.1 hypothetical protein ATNIH1004_011670 [Aspergillus tanneri]